METANTFYCTWVQIMEIASFQQQTGSEWLRKEICLTHLDQSAERNVQLGAATNVSDFQDVFSFYCKRKITLICPTEEY